MPRIQTLITKEIARTLPAIYAQEKTEDPTVFVKLFTPYSGWTWLLTEWDPATGQGFGFSYNAADPDGAELGYIHVPQLQAMRVRLGPYIVQGVERDRLFKAKPLSEAIRVECPLSRRAQSAKAA